MISTLLDNLDWLAALAGGAAYFVFGAAWYGILGKGWMAAAGLTAEQINADFNKAYYGLTFLVECIIVAFMGGMMGQDISVSDAAQFGFIVGLIFSGLTTYVHYLYTMRNGNLIIYDAGYTTIASTIAAVVYAVVS
jgi:Protein of unknown function (DUF1761)